MSLKNIMSKNFLQHQQGRAALIFWICLLIITVLSLVPGTQRPHTGMNGQFEHAAAYAATGIFMMLGYVRLRARSVGYVCVVFLSFIFEWLQVYVPGRSSNIADALASDAGLTVGVVVGWCLTAWLEEEMGGIAKNRK
jgi:VanZ family protein